MGVGEMNVDYEKIGLKCGIEVHSMTETFKNTGSKNRSYGIKKRT
jgi:Glu-tRNA(Gln) amidotransferase subunit E-like FAD-binding protein